MKVSVHDGCNLTFAITQGLKVLLGEGPQSGLYGPAGVLNLLDGLTSISLDPRLMERVQDIPLASSF